MTDPIAPTQYPPASQAILAARTSEAIGRSPDRRTGVVTTISAGVLTVAVSGGDTKNVGYLASYLPAVGDVVCLLLQRSTWVCLGKLASPADYKGQGAGAASAVATNSAPIATGVEVTTHIVSITVYPGRTYRATFRVQLSADVAGARAAHLIRLDPAGSGTIVCDYGWIGVPSVGPGFSAEGTAYLKRSTGTAATVAFNLSALIFGGNVTLNAASYRPRWFEIRDVGPADASYPHAVEF